MNKSTWALPALPLIAQPLGTKKLAADKPTMQQINSSRVMLYNLSAASAKRNALMAIPSRDSINTESVKPSDKTQAILKGGK